MKIKNPITANVRLARQRKGEPLTKLHYALTPYGQRIPEIKSKRAFITTKAFTPSGGGRGPKMPSDVGPKWRKSDRTPRTPRQRSTVKDHLHDLATRAANRVVDNLADKLTGSDHGITEPAGGERRPVMPTSAKETVRTFRLANDSETRKIHKTEYVTGFQPSSAVKVAAKNNGTAYSVIFDTKIDALTSAERNQLTQGSGFNQKGWHLPCMALQLPNRDVEKLCLLGITTSDTTPLTRTENNEQRQDTYVSIMRLKRQYMIHNTSAFFPLHFKITVCKYLGNEIPGFTPLNTFGSIIQSPAEMSAVDAAIAAGTALPGTAGKVPWVYTHGGYQIGAGVPGNAARDYLIANFSLKGRGVWESPVMKDSFRLVETFEKTIPPGDFWNFSHVHNMGSGLHLQSFAENLIANNNRDRRLDPFTYLIFFECKGTMCEAIYQKSESEQDTYLGVSPSYYTYEGKTSAYYVKNTNIHNSSDTNQSTKTIHRREFSSDPYISGNVIANIKKEFFLERNKIKATDSIAEGEMYVPIASGSVVQFKTNTNNDN